MSKTREWESQVIESALEDVKRELGAKNDALIRHEYFLEELQRDIDSLKRDREALLEQRTRLQQPAVVLNVQSVRQVRKEIPHG